MFSICDEMRSIMLLGLFQMYIKQKLFLIASCYSFFVSGLFLQLLTLTINAPLSLFRRSVLVWLDYFSVMVRCIGWEASMRAKKNCASTTLESGVKVWHWCGAFGPPGGLGCCPFWSGGSVVLDLMFYVPPIVCWGSVFVFVLVFITVYVLSSFAIILTRKRGCLCFRCLSGVLLL